MEVNNKVIWITGASSGIGEALCYKLNEIGAKLIISSRSSDGLYQVKHNCTKNQLDIHVLPLDLENTSDLQSKANAALAIYGRIDIVIHSGGVSQRSLAMETDLDVAKKIMNINLINSLNLKTKN